MEIPVSEQMRMLKKKIQKFRDMLSKPGLTEPDFDDEENENLPNFSEYRPKRFETTRRNDRKTSKLSRFDNIIQNKAPVNRNSQKITTRIINNSRGYHYSSNQPVTKTKPAPKPLLFLKKEPSLSSSSYFSDDFEEEEEEYYSSSEGSSHDDSLEEEEEEESEDVSESFSVISKVLKGSVSKETSKNTEISISTASDDERPGSLVSKLIRNVENGFSPTSSKLSSSDDVIIVQKPVSVEKESVQSENQSNDTGEFDRILTQISRQNFDISSDDDDSYSLNDIDLRKHINIPEEEEEDDEDVQSFSPLLKQTRKHKNDDDESSSRQSESK